MIRYRIGEHGVGQKEWRSSLVECFTCKGCQSHLVLSLLSLSVTCTAMQLLIKLNIAYLMTPSDAQIPNYVK